MTLGSRAVDFILQAAAALFDLNGIPVIPSRFVGGLLCLLLLWAVPADAQLRCGGHTIHWIGGAPRASLDRGPRDHDPPTVPEPEGMTARERELWDAIVYDAYDYPIPNPMSENGMTSLPLKDRRTLVIAENTVPTIQICIQSSDESYTGERLAAYSDSSWWRRQIDRWTNFSWRGDIQIDACADEPMTGWVHVRQGEEGEVTEGRLAHARSWRYFDPHGIGGRWSRSEIVWHPEAVQDTNEDYFEVSLAHELGHVLGLWHAPPGSGFVMVGTGETPPRPWTDKERWLSQWAYFVGPNVQYPGLLRPAAPRTPGSLSEGVKDLVDEALEDLQDDSGAREATESVPALPTAGVLLLVTLVGLLGRRRLRAG